jgi:small ligand-binding sensory domain FIST
MKIWLTKRDEKKMFDGVDQLVQWILASLNGKKPLAVFHADCVMRGRFSLNRILKDEIINQLQVPLCKGEKIPWLGLYSGGEFAMIGKQNFLHGFSSSLFVIYR